MQTICLQIKIGVLLPLLNATIQHALLLFKHALLLSNLVVLIDTVNVNLASCSSWLLGYIARTCPCSIEDISLCYWLPSGAVFSGIGQGIALLHLQGLQSHAYLPQKCRTRCQHEKCWLVCAGGWFWIQKGWLKKEHSSKSFCRSYSYSNDLKCRFWWMKPWLQWVSQWTC